MKEDNAKQKTQKNSLLEIFYVEVKHDLPLVFVFVSVFILFSLFVPYFLTNVNLRGLGLSISQLMMVAATMSLCLAAKDFDLSVGAQVAFFAVVSVIFVNHFSILVAILLCILIGLIIGLFHGAIITKLGINAFITTLASMQIIRGLAYIISDGKAVTLNQGKEAFYLIGSYQFLGGIPMPIVISFVVLVIFTVVLHNTSHGRNALAVGGNIDASYMAGLMTDRIRTINYCLQGAVCAIAGIVLASKLNSGSAEASQGFELMVISACILGGVSLNGGKASMLGVIVGVLILGTIENVMNLLSVPTFYQYLIRGMVLLIAVGIDQLKHLKKVRSSRTG